MVSEILCIHCGTANQPIESFCENCGAQLHILLNRRYRVLNQLGAGGFGTVFKVEDIQFNNRPLAAKKLDLDAIPPKEQRDAINAFKQEANMLATLQHPNLPRIYEYFSENNDHYLVMDFIEGETLEEHTQKLNPPVLPTLEVVRIAIQLTTALAYLHTRQPAIIFRDLKPANIMITPRDEVYLIDFGIARHFKPGQAGDTIKWGTREYAAPEQLAGRQTSTLSDIYSLGVVLHQLLSGDDPIPYQFTPHQLAPLKLSGPGKVNLGKLIMHMMEYDKQARPPSMITIKQELEHIAQILQPTATKPGKQPSQASKVASQTPAIVSKNVPPKPQGKTQGELCYDYPHASHAIHALAWSPDGLHLAAAGERETQVYVWSALDGKTTMIYKQHTRAIHALAWSPDSQFVASASNDYTVQVWRVSTGNLHNTYQQHTHWINALAWSPDGNFLASGDAQNQIHLWGAQDCQQKLIYRGHTSAILALTFSPDSSRIASADGRGSIHVWEVANSKLLTTYAEHQKSVSALAWSSNGTYIVSGSQDGTLHIWEVSSGKHLSTYTGHQRLIKDIAWSPTNGYIASTGKDHTVQIWNPRNSNTLYTYRGHTSDINALAWSPDSSLLASAGNDSAIHVWWTN